MPTREIRGCDRARDLRDALGLRLRDPLRIRGCDTLSGLRLRSRGPRVSRCDPRPSCDATRAARMVSSCLLVRRLHRPASTSPCARPRTTDCGAPASTIPSAQQQPSVACASCPRIDGRDGGFAGNVRSLCTPCPLRPPLIPPPLHPHPLVPTLRRFGRRAEAPTESPKATPTRAAPAPRSHPPHDFRLASAESEGFPPCDQRRLEACVSRRRARASTKRASPPIERRSSSHAGADPEAPPRAVPQRRWRGGVKRRAARRPKSAVAQRETVLIKAGGCLRLSHRGSPRFSAEPLTSEHEARSLLRGDRRNRHPRYDSAPGAAFFATATSEHERRGLPASEKADLADPSGSCSSRVLRVWRLGRRAMRAEPLAATMVADAVAEF